MEQAQQSFDIGKYIGIIRRRKWWAIIPVVLLVPITIVLAAKFAPPNYGADVTLFIGSTKAEEQVDFALRLDAERVAKRKLADIENRMLDYTTVRNLFVGDQAVSGLVTDPKTGEQLVDVNNPVELEKAISDLQKDVQLELQGSEYVKISYKNTDSATAIRVVSNLVDAFLNNWIGKVKTEYEDILNQHQTTIEQIVQQSNEADRKLREFREELTKVKPNSQDQPSGIVLLTTDPAFLVRRLEDIRKRLNEIEYEIPSKEERVAFLKKELMQLTESKEVSKEYERSVMSQKLSEAIADLQINRLMLQDEFTDDHPRIKKIDNQIAMLKAKEGDTQDEVFRRTVKEDPLYYDYRKEQKELELEINMLKEERKSLQGFAKHIEDEIAAYPKLKEQESIYERNVLALNHRYEKALEAKAEAQQRYQLATEARMDAFERVGSVRGSQQPDFKDSLKLIGLGLFVSIACAIGLVVGREVLDQSFTNVDEARDFLRLPSLGYVPVIVTRRDKRRKLLRIFAVVVVFALVIGAAAYGYFQVPAIHQAMNEIARQLYGMAKSLLPV